MRWQEKLYKHGETRTKRAFLLFPRVINGEWRWLEHAWWEERYYSYAAMGGMGWGWESVRWIDVPTHAEMG